jgi:hypothetical protein
MAGERAPAYPCDVWRPRRPGVGPGTRECRGSQRRFAFSVLTKGKLKKFAWSWKERVERKKPRVPRRTCSRCECPTSAKRSS